LIWGAVQVECPEYGVGVLVLSAVLAAPIPDLAALSDAEFLDRIAHEPGLLRSRGLRAVRHHPERRDLVARLGRTVGAMRAQTV